MLAKPHVRSDVPPQRRPRLSHDGADRRASAGCSSRHSHREHEQRCGRPSPLLDHTAHTDHGHAASPGIFWRASLLGGPGWFSARWDERAQDSSRRQAAAQRNQVAGTPGAHVALRRLGMAGARHATLTNVFCTSPRTTCCRALPVAWGWSAEATAPVLVVDHVVRDQVQPVAERVQTTTEPGFHDGSRTPLRMNPCQGCCGSRSSMLGLIVTSGGSPVTSHI